MTTHWQEIVIKPETSIRNALQVIDQQAMHAAVVTLECNELVGLVSDGDVRRAILDGVDLESPVRRIMNRNPIRASYKLANDEFKKLMQEKKILLLPIVNDEGKLVDIKTLHETLIVTEKQNPVFLMAGGFGKRLRPLTDNCPKPMLKVGGKPMLETLINHFKSQGFHNFYISTHYLPEIIENYFGTGEALGVNITYVHESQPLGTGGALSLLPNSMPELPLIMINGDILTNVNFSKVLDFHNRNSADATMCVRDYEVKIPFGVVEGLGHEISDIVEKPTYRYFVNAGIYVVSPSIISSLPKQAYLDMPTLFDQQRDAGARTLKYPIHEYWLDVGRHDDFNRAQTDIHDLGLL